jgi:predicted GNAT family N-acyltransferase
MSDLSSLFAIEPLNKHHDKSTFSCGEPALDRYIKEQASQDVKRGLSRVFVATLNNKVVGFYSLSATSVSHNSLPADIARKLPKYPVPAVLLGRLARDKLSSEKGLGEILLVNALKRVLLANQEVAMYALVVDAKHEAAKAFYQRYGFIALEDYPMRLFLPLDTIAQMEKV